MVSPLISKSDVALARTFLGGHHLRTWCCQCVCVSVSVSDKNLGNYGGKELEVETKLAYNSTLRIVIKCKGGKLQGGFP